MGLCFSKPKKKQLLAESRERIQANVRTLAVCLELSDDEAETEPHIKRVYDDVSYMTPSALVAVMQLDKKINALAGDLKIALTKGKERDVAKALAILRDLELIVVERNTYK